MPTYYVLCIFNIYFSLLFSPQLLQASLTHAYTVAMIQMLGVFVMAGGSWLVLSESVPKAMWLALGISLIGSMMVLHGRTAAAAAMMAPATEEAAATAAAAATADTSSDKYWDSVGVLVQCASLFFSTGSRLQMRLSEGLFVPMEFMRMQYLGGGGFALAWCICVTGFDKAFQPWMALKLVDWVIFFSLAICIHFIAATSQVHFNRRLGVATYAVFQPMRLVGSMLGSWVLLSEPVVGTYTWAGLVVVGGTVTGYAYWKNVYGPKKNNKKATATTMATMKTTSTEMSGAAAAAAAAAGSATQTGTTV